MCDKLKICVIKEIDFDDFEECIAKDYRHYVKLKSREEPYEVSDFTYREMLKWIAKVNAKRKEPKSCPFCGGTAHAYKNNFWWVACERANHGCVTMGAFLSEEEAITAWNRRAE